ncbi:hypothetical protein G3T14_19605 [Methylobacterium sp. BTF04]|uniref:hypothetical protein n=1 Tax=Methylobacterium sp. BTF04 TaxID=2708300 RepID=UPI0013D13D44|nr:hypothetical protein [Methylobacterium sp. BTF04]NEU14316.1 hypothetical protein [Methylobacterium sp. BTF04]
MSDAPALTQKPITIVEMNGRIAELERQRDQALTRCSLLAGEKAEALDLLRAHVAEVERLNAVIIAASPPGEPGAAGNTSPACPLQ